MKRAAVSVVSEEAPLRAELFSTEQMEAHGRALAAAHALIAAPRVEDPLLDRLADNERTLVAASVALTSSANERQGAITPAIEWLLDNFYLVEEQIRIARRHLSPDYGRELPHLAAGSAAGLPRVYALALDAIAHGDGHIDLDILSRFISAYQSAAELTLGELWAIPIMLRLALIENLRRIAAHIVTANEERELATLWGERMTTQAEEDPKNLIVVIADMARAQPPMSCSFVAELVRHLQHRGQVMNLPLSWLEQHLGESQLSTREAIQLENQLQAANQISVSNSIGSLRLLGAIDWREFVEAMSTVEHCLRSDPAGVYPAMDFATRDHYRHAVEIAARETGVAEIEVARAALKLAHAGVAAGVDADGDSRGTHVGYFLIDRGRSRLHRQLCTQGGRRRGLRQRIGSHLPGIPPLTAYLGATALISALAAAGLMDQLVYVLPRWALAPLALAAVIASSHLAAALVNWVTTLMTPPSRLPAMDFSAGIGAQWRTLVVIPTMLGSARDVDELVETLEVHFLANRDPHLHFALLTDFPDADVPTLSHEAAVLELACARIQQLNAQYGGAETGAEDGAEGNNARFFLFHRARRWNAAQGKWMGRERKRGKLAALNALLRAREGEAFDRIVGEHTVLHGVRFVITLDTDTTLPRDVARELIGVMAHPLNRPRYDARRRCVVDGYGILQPAVATRLPSSKRSLFARLYAGDAGIDPYTRASSDVYQDLFSEGSFVGKGIYDVDAFERSAGERFPDNRVLSHDLLEGCHARAGFVSTISLFEDAPPSYRSDVRRRQRWVRGDWQLLDWLWWRVPCKHAGRRRETNPLSMLSRWKLFDNLRRSLVPIALTTLFITGWLLLPTPLLWTLAVLGMIGLPALCETTLTLLDKPVELLWRQHVTRVTHVLGRRCAQLGFELACLPHTAWVNLDAIARTLWRLKVSRVRLLEWQPSREADRALMAGGQDSLQAHLRAMWAAPALAVVVFALLAAQNPSALAIALPVLLAWLGAPVLAWWLSRPLRPPVTRLNPAQRRQLGMLARQTWAYFETFVNAQENWLPPDNVQEGRADAVAGRTSPTNIGLALLANLAAHDFGYLATAGLLQRTQDSLATLEGMERYRGHFYNWYDTRSLRPLTPRYVSSVDSGNLAVYLLTLRTGLLGLADQPASPLHAVEGVRDAFAVLVSCAPHSRPEHAAFAAVLDALHTPAKPTLAAWHDRLHQLRAAAAALARAYDVDADTASEAALCKQFASAHWSARAESTADQKALDAVATAAEAPHWACVLHAQCAEALTDLEFLLPWLVLRGATAGADAVLASALADTLEVPSLRVLAALDEDSAVIVQLLPEAADQLAEAIELRRLLASGAARARQRLYRLGRLAQRCAALAEMDFSFLYNPKRRLLSVGYSVSAGRIDASHYDLLASEARQGVFVAIAQGQLPQDSWFALGRLLTRTTGEPALLSWSGSMFEYLMPQLVMPVYAGTLLDQTARAAVAQQIEYGRQRNVPWGISESGYNAIDVQRNYQYRAFGVPGLGLMRGLADDLVVAPYASVLALMVAPAEACDNLRRLGAKGLAGRFGLYEAIDYTPARQRPGQSGTVVRAFMAHHQGMSLLALLWVLRDRPMQRRFLADRSFQAAMLLLHERVPHTTAVLDHTAQLSGMQAVSAVEAPVRRFDSPDTAVPEVDLLSNGRYHVMVSNAGGGYSRWKEYAVTRWREDLCADDHGSFCYVRDLSSGKWWSAAHQPTRQLPAFHEVTFSAGRAEFRRRDVVPTPSAFPDFTVHSSEIETYTEVAVSPEDDIELRRLRITNHSRQPRRIELTSYAEVVIAPHADDLQHPAFSKLFVQTEIVPERNAILCTRRPRSSTEQPPWMLHLMVVREDAVEGAVEVGELSYETDRERFIGRGNSVAAPQALIAASGPLSGTEGAVLDAVVAIRCVITLNARQCVTVDIVNGMAHTRAAVEHMVDRYRDRHLADRVFDLSWTHSQIVLRQLDQSEDEAQRAARLASAIIYANPALRAEAAVLLRNRRGQSGLWGYGISGDLPIVLLQMCSTAGLTLARQLVKAHGYWRQKGLAVDLVIWNEEQAGYRHRLQDEIMGLITSGLGAGSLDQAGGIFVRMAEHIAAEDRVLLQAVARVVLSDSAGSLDDQLERLALRLRMPIQADFSPRPQAAFTALPAQDALIQSNGSGGFSADGREYVITLNPGQRTPAPWVNVIANPHFGTIVSESGSAYTWSGNAHAFRLTPWHNDPVSDSGGEAFYLRDEDSGRVWSPTIQPAPMAAQYRIRHGFGYSVFETIVDDIASELWVYVAIDAKVKFSRLKLRNRGARKRRLSATAYVEWVLGDVRANSAMHVRTWIDETSGALMAANAFDAEFTDEVAFFDVVAGTRSLTADRVEFIGRNGSLRAPAALRRRRLSGRSGAGFDPCGALKVDMELDAGGEREIVFRLGSGRDGAEASALAQRFRAPESAREALDEVHRYWARTLDTIQVDTPDAAINVLANGWLCYQTLASRLWGRSGYYQSGGAYGFRDQLQDVMALMHAEPALAREHILRSAGRQFEEGDVQHWWHPPGGRGVRTRCSDDYLWLPLAVSRYVELTGDTSVLDEEAGFLDGPALEEGVDSRYDLPAESPLRASVYEHCKRAIRRGMRCGQHGLPLIDGGDWNDGMNRVGIEGRGESVWLAFFQYEVLRKFVPLAHERKDHAFGRLCRSEGERLRWCVDEYAWDGAWYRRAWFDDGRPLGSAASPECRIDSISQSWAVLSGAGDGARARAGMAAVAEQLLDRDANLLRLLTPAFEHSDLDPGYIRGYPPGVRENGGQYTHGALWAAMAFAELGEVELAWEVLNRINPINHARTQEAVARYRVEPYVVAADVYGRAPHLGRGGWTWYTGSAAWMYRLITESLLGLHRAGDTLRLQPRLPAAWTAVTVRYRHFGTLHHVHIRRTADSGDAVRLRFDGDAVEGEVIELRRDGRDHHIEVELQ